MKKRIKRCFGLIMSGVLLCVISGISVFAQDVEINENLHATNQEIYAKLYNPEENKMVLQRIDAKRNEVIDIIPEGVVIQSEYEIEAFVPEENFENEINNPEILEPVNYSKSVLNNNLRLNEFSKDYGFVTCDTKTKTKYDDSISVKASITLTYTTRWPDRVGGYYVTLTKVNGSWTITQKSVSIKSRQVDCYAAPFNNTKKLITIYPRSNTFTQNISWGETKWYSGGSSVGATSKAKLQRGTGNPWYLELQCVIDESDF